MKKIISLTIALSFIFIFTACVGNTENNNENTTAEFTAEHNEAYSFTIEQLQQAMLPQFLLGSETDILEQQVISAQRVERDSDYVWFEPGQEYLDASNAVRYRLEIRHRELSTIWHPLGDGFYDAEQVIGDFVTSVRYRDFNLVDGEPELLYVSC